MSNKRNGLLKDSMIATGGDMDSPRAMTPYQVKELYEAARAKDAELIQQLVDGMWSDEGSTEWNTALDAAEAAGFKRTEP